MTTAPPNTVAFPRGRQIAPNAVIGTLIFCFTELMVFAGLLSAFTIYRAQQAVWPPPLLPTLPAGVTALNSLALFASAGALFIANRRFRADREAARAPMRIALLLGTLFVVVQTAEWMVMIAEGLTMASSNLGAFFYLIIGCHALHCVGAITALGIVYYQLKRGRLRDSFFFGSQVFWYFVVGVWPAVYWRVYF